MPVRSSAHTGSNSSVMLEQLEQRLMLAVDPVSGMSITADTTFNAGTFTLTAGITIDADNVTLSGAGQGVTIIKLVANDPNGVNMITVDGQSTVTIEDMTIDGQRTSQGAWLWGATPHWEGIHVIDSSYTTVQNVTVQHMGNNGIQFTSSVWNVYYEDNHVYDSTAIDNGWLNTSHRGGGVWMTNSNNSSIERSSADENGYHGLGGAGDNLQVLDSSADDNWQGGFVINGGTNCLIDNNVGDGNGHGVGLYSSFINAANVASNNTVTNSDNSGIQILNEVDDPAYANILENNTISGAGPGGFAGIYASHGGDYYIIRNNEITNVDYGIYINGNDNVVVENNTVSNIGISGIVQDLAVGDTSTNVTITGNTVTNAGSNGITATGLSATGLVIDGNNINTTGGYGIYGGYQNRPGIVITNNSITSSTLTGVYFEGGGASGAVVATNHISSSNAGGIGVASSPDVIIERNVVDGARTVGITVHAGSDNARIINNVIKNVHDGGSGGDGIQTNAMFNWIFGNRLEAINQRTIRGGQDRGNWKQNYGDENSGGLGFSYSDNGETPGTDTLTYAEGTVRFDLNGDTFINAADIDILSAAVLAGSNELRFDIDGDSDSDPACDQADFDYLVEMIFQTGLGDAQLDHDVDVNDLNLWKASRFTTGTGWATGDFDGDTDTDVNDLNLWKSNRFTDYSSVVDLLA